MPKPTPRQTVAGTKLIERWVQTWPLGGPYEEIVSRIYTAMESAGWEDIASAPRDYDDILLWNGVRVTMGWFMDCSDYSPEVKEADHGWHDSTSADHCDNAMDPQPTHWRPLPPPKAKEEE